jgi:hypothetical protein
MARRRRKSRRITGRNRLARAARACKGKTKGKFRACMRKKLRKRK